MTKRTEEQKRRRRLLRVLAEHGPMSQAEVASALQRANFATPRRLDALVRFGHVAHHPDTDTFTITERGLMRIGKKNPQTTASAGAVLPGAGGSNVINLADETDRLVYEFAEAEGRNGDDALLFHVLRDEVVLWERAKAALASGWPAPSMRDVPRYRRLAAIEAALDEWDEDTDPEGCGYCGTNKRPSTGYPSRGYLDDDTAPFQQRKDGTTACRFCFEFIAANGVDALRRAVFNAVVGVMGSGGAFAADAAKRAVPFAHELGSARSAVPWAHLTPTHREAMRLAAAQSVHPRRFIRTVGQSDDHRLPGLVPPIHDAPARPAYVAPTVLKTPTYPEEIRAAEERHRIAEEQFKAENPPAYVAGGTVWSDDVAKKWFVLLETHRRELVAIDRRYPTHGDGRPRNRRGHLNPLPLAR